MVSFSSLLGPCSSLQLIAVILTVQDCLYYEDDALTMLAQKGLAMRGLRPLFTWIAASTGVALAMT